jgi:hypothetical protein
MAESDPSPYRCAGMRYFRLNRSRSYEAAKTGAIPTVRIGRRIFAPVVAHRQMSYVSVIGAADRYTTGQNSTDVWSAAAFPSPSQQRFPRRRPKLHRKVVAAVHCVGSNDNDNAGGEAPVGCCLTLASESIRSRPEDIEQSTGKSWHTDPFAAAALKHAVETLMFYFTRLTAKRSELAKTPSTVEDLAAEMSSELAQQFRTPAGHGQMIAYNMIVEIRRAATSLPDSWMVPASLQLPTDIAMNLGRDLFPDRIISKYRRRRKK